MKKVLFISAMVMMMTGCGMMTNSSSTNAQPQAATAQTTAPATALSAGQGAGNAMLQLYNQYKADGNKYDYTNMQNMLNTVTLVANCEGLKNNYKDKTYLKEFGQGMISSSLGLITKNNVETVTNSLVDMVKNSEAVQSATSKAQSTASSAAGYANTAAQYAGAISTLLSAFGSSSK
jgi:hypothetical protein